MIKKKIIAVVMLPVMLLSGCGGETVASPAPKDVTSAVLEQVEIPSGVEKTKDDLADYYIGLDTDKVEDASFWICGSSAYPDEISVIKMSSSSDVDSAKEAVQARLDSQKELYSTYTPEEMYKLDTAELYTKGNYIIFLACSDNEKAKSAADEMF